MLPLLEAEAEERHRLNGGDKKSEEALKSDTQQVEGAITKKNEAAREAAAIAGTNAAYVYEAKYTLKSWKRRSGRVHALTCELTLWKYCHKVNPATKPPTR